MKLKSPRRLSGNDQRSDQDECTTAGSLQKRASESRTLRP